MDERGHVAGGAVRIAIEELERLTLDELRPGEALPSEGELARTLSISRLTVREAVRALEARGLLELRKGRRPVVREPNEALAADYFRIAVRRDPSALFELQEVRLALEVHVAALAARHASRASLAAMRAAIDGMRMAEDEEAFHDADVRFHESLAVASGNGMLTQLIESLAEPLRIGRRHGYRGRLREGRPFDEVVEAHRAILYAVERRDPAAAARAMETHLRATERDLRAALEPQEDVED
jgi:GntR family transcriptional repressor for pyruvate dehydrogenase complex